jgi:hypothetical protein
MRLLTVAASLVALVLGPCLAQAAIVNLVPNGSFETADPQHPDQPLGLTPQRTDAVAGATSEGGQMAWEKTGHWGQRSLAITNPTAADFGFWQVTVPVKPDTDYVLSVYTRCQTLGGQPEVVVQLPGKKFTDPGGFDWYLAPTTEWNESQRSLRTLPDQTQLSLSLVLYNRGGQTAWFDDLALVEAASLPRLTASWPENGAVLAPQEVQFTFQPAASGEKYVLQYARNAYFSRNPVEVSPLEQTRAKPARPLAPGTWYWRVGALGDDGRPYFAATQGFLIATGRSPFQHADTTPPAVFRPRPAPDSTVDGRDAVITASFADASSGINARSARLLLDGKDVTAFAAATGTGIVYQPKGLAQGLHQVELTVRDAAGNQSNVCHWQFGLGSPVAVSGRFAKNGVFLLNGRPHFPMGLYSYCLNPSGGNFDPALLARASAAGFNAELVEDTGAQPALDAFLQHGMKVILSARQGLEASTDQAQARIGMVEQGPVRWKGHPALLGYWADEPDRMGADKLKLGYQAIKAADPDHPAMWCLCDPSLYRQNAVDTDAVMPDIYPVPSSPMAVICTQIQQAIRDSDGKPIWFIPQAFDWAITGGTKVGSPGKWRPTAEELRLMTYLGIVAGSRGIFYWASDTDAMNDIVWYAAQWDEALKMAGEVRYLNDVLAAGTPLRDVAVECSEPDVYSAGWTAGGRKLLIVANAATAPVECRLKLPGARQVNCLFEDRKLASGSDFRDLFRPYEVHIYEWK